MEEIPEFPVRDGEFDLEFPLFIVVQNVVSQPTADEPGKFDVAFSGPASLTMDDGAQVIPVFTDEYNAKEFIAAHAVGSKVLILRDPSAMIGFLKSCTAIATHVAFDPYRVGMRATTCTIDAFIRDLESLENK